LAISTAEIGERLFISERTATKHVSNSLEKRSVGSRTQAIDRRCQLCGGDDADEELIVSRERNDGNTLDVRVPLRSLS
jgi:hypothetical protein